MERRGWNWRQPLAKSLLFTLQMIRELMGNHGKPSVPRVTNPMRRWPCPSSPAGLESQNASLSSSHPSKQSYASAAKLI